MIRKVALSFVFLLAVAASAVTQVNVRGYLVLPNGDPPQNPIRFYLRSDDGQINEYRFTDSHGRFILERLSSLVSYTITVDGDGSTYDTTTYSFMPSYEATPRIMLKPLPRKAPAGSSTISAASGYRPNPQAEEEHNAGVEALKKQKNDVAEKHFRKAIALDTKFVAPQNDLAVLLMQQKKYDEAEKVLRQAVETDPKSLHALLNLGITLNHLQKYAESIPFLREALRLQPGALPAHLHLGIALLETDQLKEAETELTRVVKTPGPEDIPGQMYLGKLYARTGDFQKAIAAFEIYLQKAPNAANAEEVRGLIERMKRDLAAKR